MTRKWREMRRALRRKTIRTVLWAENARKAQESGDRETHSWHFDVPASSFGRILFRAAGLSKSDATVL
jgi:hypothetical protein